MEPGGFSPRSSFVSIDAAAAGVNEQHEEEEEKRSIAEEETAEDVADKEPSMVEAVATLVDMEPARPAMLNKGAAWATSFKQKPSSPLPHSAATRHNRNNSAPARELQRGQYRPESLRFKDQCNNHRRECDDQPPILSSRNVVVEQRVQKTPSGAIRKRDVLEHAGVSAHSVVLRNLMVEGFPDGLARELALTKKTCPLHYWCIDNSASMYKTDCHRIVQEGQRQQDDSKNTANGVVEVVKCTRWTELKESAKYHASLAGVLGATTVFRFLNHPGYNLPPEELVVTGQQDADVAVDVLENMRPDGVSQLTQHVQLIYEKIASMKDQLIENGQKVVVILATDGIPSDQFGESSDATKREFAEALKMLQLLPVWIVIRLCTNERTVLNYYRLLDKELERPIDVVGDFLNEAKEVMRLNFWLNYSVPLHRAREIGYNNRLFDLLDERKLTKDELGEFLELIFGKGLFDNAPNMHTDWNGYVSFFEESVLSKEPMQWNPHSRKMESWIDVRKLKACYAGGAVREKRAAFVKGVQRMVSRDVI